MPIGVDFHDGAKSDREQLLAMRSVRRNLERFTTGIIESLVPPVAVTIARGAR
jgi:hypothetical protein